MDGTKTLSKRHLGPFDPRLSMYDICCHVSGVCVTNKTGFGFDDRIYWTVMQLITTVHMSMTHCHLPTGHSTGTILTSNWTELHCSVVLLRIPLYSRLCPLIIPRQEPHRKHRHLLSRMRVYWSVTYQWMSNWWERHLGNVFTKPLLSNGNMRHNMIRTLGSNKIRV
jgi:hypothetical protein